MTMALLGRVKRAVKAVFRDDAGPNDPIRQELERLRSAPRHMPLTTDLFGFRFELVDGASFVACYESIVRRGTYRFTSPVDAPYVIDCGANVGVSVVYFKQMYPQSRILAFEADPAVFSTLEANVQRAEFANVELVNKAVWTERGEIPFWHEGADAGRIARPADNGGNDLSPVPTVRLRDYLREPVDLLKLDIEGAEVDVLLDCGDALRNVRTLFVEYHSFASQAQRLDLLMATLTSAGFRLFVQTEQCAPQPFVRRTAHLGMDLQLNIFGVRTEDEAETVTRDP